MKEQITRARY